ncbi:matrixin family metalloprotease [Streptomyces sp. NPDC059447]|uniref:matrixin family metalloprotease n=1 Tax=Streptomyces sp. NPDC059447 TaxID=3346834 RepID=UPI0036AA7F2D
MARTDPEGDIDDREPLVSAPADRLGLDERDREERPSPAGSGGDMKATSSHGTPGEAFFGIACVDTVKRGQKLPSFKRVESFLQQFGYLDHGEYVCRGVLGDDVSSALASYQEQHALRVTGEFDEATRDQMTTARCAMRDVPRFEKACPWDRTDLTYAFDSGTVDIQGDGEWGGVRSAFETWEIHTPLTFFEVHPTDGPDIMVGWRPTMDPDFNMTGSKVAHADFPPKCELLSPGLPQPLHFDNGEQFWAIGAEPGAHDVESVALHEIGHLIGLEHSTDPNAVMFSSLSSNTLRRHLTQDDLTGALDLYPPS